MYCAICRKRQTKGSKGTDFELRKCPVCNRYFCRECGTSHCKDCILQESLSPDYLQSLKKVSGSALTLLFTFLLLAVPVLGAVDDAWLYYSMDDADVSGSLIADLAAPGGYDNGTIVSATTGQAGILGQSFLYDNTNDYINFTNFVSDIVTHSKGAISLWFNSPNATGNKRLLSCTKNDNDNFFILNINNDGDIVAQLQDANVNDILFVTDGQIKNGEWYHFVFTQDGTTSRMYLNASVQSATDSGQWFSTDIPDIINCYIGRDTTAGWFQGYIDEVAIYNHTLNLTEIQQLFNSGAGYNPYQAATINVDITAPDNNSEYSAGNNSISVVYNGSASEGLASCNFSIDGVENQTASNVNLSVSNHFNVTLASTGHNYSLNIRCNTSSVYDNTAIHVWVDSALPSASIYNPLDNHHYFNDDIPFDASCTDQELYRANATLYNSSGGVQWSYQNTSIVGNAWVFDLDSDTDTVDPGWNNFTIICVDAHTTEELKILKSPSVIGSRVLFDDFEVRFEEDFFQKVTVNEETDRFSFDITHLSPVDYVSFRIIADDIDYVGDRYGFCGHAIINGRFWFDAEPAERCEVEFEDGSVVITAYFREKSLDLVSRSVGELNVQEASVRFYSQNESVTYDYNMTLPASFGDSDLDTSTTAGMLYLFLLLAIVAFLVWMAERSRIPAMGFIAGFAVAMFGFIIGWKVSFLIGALVVVGGLGYGLLRAVG